MSAQPSDVFWPPGVFGGGGLEDECDSHTPEESIAGTQAPADAEPFATDDPILVARRSVSAAIAAANSPGFRPTATVAFSLVQHLAVLPEGECADAVSQLKTALGSSLNLISLRQSIKKQKKENARNERGRNARGKPHIVVNDRQMGDVTHDIIAALVAENNPPVVFLRGGAPTCIRSAEKGPPVLSQMNEPAMRGRIARVAEFYVATQRDDIAVSPPVENVRDILALDLVAYAKEHKLRPFPPIDGVTTTPVLRPDWSVVTTPGYDEPTRLFYAPSPDFTMEPVSEFPTPNMVRQAVELIEEAFGEFPYESEADKANAVAALITPPTRPAINSKSPLAIVEAPQAGNGKSLFVEAVCRTATGCSPAMMGAPGSDEEMRKQITATLLTGPAVIVIDNIDGPISSGSLARALTASIWSDRLLGSTQQVSLSNIACWLATGNNIELAGDLPRRCYRIRLDAKTSRPWAGRTFRHPNLLEWIDDNRGRLIWAVLTLARAWHAAGQPPSDTPIIGSFEGWSRVVGGILQFAQIPGFLANLRELYEQNDESSAEWERFLTVWVQRYGTDPVTVAKILIDLENEEGGALRDALPDGLGSMVSFQPAKYMESPKFVIKEAGRFKIKLGKQLKQRVGRRYGDRGLHLQREDDKHLGTAKWSVHFAGSAGSGGSVSNPTRYANNIRENEENNTSHGRRLANTPGTPSTPRNPENPDANNRDFEEREAIFPQGVL
jgi:hypothetical protein